VLIVRTKHHFYVEEKTERAIWVHPYDDPDYIKSLPDTHPANPESQAARERREEIERAEERAKRVQARGGNMSDTDTDEEGPGMSSRAAMMQKSEQEDRSWLQRQKDKLSDHKEKRAQRKAEERRQRIEQEKQIRVSFSLASCLPALTITETSRGVQEEEGRASTRTICRSGIFSIRSSINGIPITIGNGSRRTRSIIRLR